VRKTWRLHHSRVDSHDPQRRQRWSQERIQARSRHPQLRLGSDGHAAQTAVRSVQRASRRTTDARTTTPPLAGRTTANPGARAYDQTKSTVACKAVALQRYSPGSVRLKNGRLHSHRTRLHGFQVLTRHVEDPASHKREEAELEDDRNITRRDKSRTNC